MPCAEKRSCKTLLRNRHSPLRMIISESIRRIYCCMASRRMRILLTSAFRKITHARKLNSNNSGFVLTTSTKKASENFRGFFYLILQCYYFPAGAGFCNIFIAAYKSTIPPVRENTLNFAFFFFSPGIITFFFAIERSEDVSIALFT